ncbi:MAG: hypothetical protein AB7I19_15735 [Planctomycetota bacterium]
MLANSSSNGLPLHWLLLAVVLSWALTWAHTCRFHWRTGIFRNRALARRVRSQAFAALPIRFVFLYALHELFARTCHLNAAWFLGIAVPWVWIEKLLRGTIEPLMHESGWGVVESLLGFDSHLWARIRKAQQEELVTVTARLRAQGHGRAQEIGKRIEAERARIHRHQALQQRFAWLLGGDWYRDRTRRDLSDPRRHSHPRVFELLVNALGVQAFGDAAQQEAREFARRLVVLRPARPLQLEWDRKSFPVTLIDSSATGLRVKLADSWSAADGGTRKLQIGDEVVITGERTVFRCKVTRVDQRKKLVGLRTRSVREVSPRRPTDRSR